MPKISWLIVTLFVFVFSPLSQASTAKFEKKIPDAAARLGAAVRIETISNDEFATKPECFRHFQSFLKGAFPRLHQKAKIKTFAHGSVLFQLQGRNSKLSPVLWMAHQDVVPVAPGTLSHWDHPPFSGVLADGYIWGRGSWDDKGNLMAQLEAIEAALSAGWSPDRTLYLAYGHDEESKGSGAKEMADYLEAQQIRFEWALDEGLLVTLGIMKEIKQPLALIGIAEKGYLTLRLSFEMPPSHSSAPPSRTAIGVLGKAVASLEAQPLEASPPTSVLKSFEGMAPALNGLNQFVFKHAGWFWPLISMKMKDNPSALAMVRTTLAPTIFQSGIKENILPAKAEATLNLRLLPGFTMQQAIEAVKKRIHDPEIKVEVVGEPREELETYSTESSGYQAIAHSIHEVFPDAMIAPGLMIATTDSYHFRKISKDIYRFSPVTAGPEDLPRFHGTNERIAISNYEKMIQFYEKLLKTL